MATFIPNASHSLCFYTLLAEEPFFSLPTSPMTLSGIRRCQYLQLHPLVSRSQQICRQCIEKDLTVLTLHAVNRRFRFSTMVCLSRLKVSVFIKTAFTLRLCAHGLVSVLLSPWSSPSHYVGPSPIAGLFANRAWIPQLLSHRFWAVTTRSKRRSRCADTCLYLHTGRHPQTHSLTNLRIDSRVTHSEMKATITKYMGHWWHQLTTLNHKSTECWEHLPTASGTTAWSRRQTLPHLRCRSGTEARLRPVEVAFLTLPFIPTVQIHAYYFPVWSPASPSSTSCSQMGAPAEHEICNLGGTHPLRCPLG